MQAAQNGKRWRVDTMDAGSPMRRDDFEHPICLLPASNQPSLYSIELSTLKQSRAQLAPRSVNPPITTSTVHKYYAYRSLCLCIPITVDSTTGSYDRIGLSKYICVHLPGSTRIVDCRCNCLGVSTQQSLGETKDMVYLSLISM